MGLVVCDGGCGALLKVIRDNIYLAYQVRLYSNDRTPGRSDTILMYTEADFSGYPGPVTIQHWSVAAVVAHVAAIRADQIPYLHSGGPLGCYVFGYYVTDGAGALIWAESRPVAPVPMFSAGSALTVIPQLTLTSDLP